MDFNYSISNPYIVEVSPTHGKNVYLTINGDLDVQRTSAYTFDSTYIDSVQNIGGENGNHVDFRIAVKPYTGVAETTIAFDLVDTSENTYRTTNDSLRIVVKQEEPYAYLDKPSITFSENVIEVDGQSGHTYNMVYKNNVASYTAYSTAEWARIVGDVSGATIEVEYDRNDGDARTADIVYEAMEKTSSPFARTYIFYFTISQAASGSQPVDGTLSFEKQNATIQSGGGFFDFGYSGENIFGLTFTSDSSWIYPRDFDDGNVSIFIPVNNGEERNGKLIAKATDANGNELMASVNIFQLSDLYMPLVELSRDSITVPYSAGTDDSVTYSVENCDHMVVWSDDDWIEVNERSMMPSFGRISFNYSANDYSSRIGYIHIRNYGDNEIYTETTLTVQQQEVPGWQNLPRCEFEQDSIQLNTWGATSGTVAYTLYNVQQGREIAIIEDSSEGAVTILNQGELSWYAYANPTDEERVIRVGIEFYATGGTAYQAWVSLIQPAPGNVEEVPIWKDTDVVIEDSQGTYKDYTIDSNGIQLHHGRVYGNPSNILLNGILRGYMKESFDPQREGIQDNGGYIGCSLSVNGVPKYYFNIFNDWSYEEREGSVLANQIRDKVVVGQYLPQSFKCVGGNILYADGNSYQLSSGIYTYNKRVEGFDPITYTIGDESYILETEEACSDYVLYYRNLYGGYDWFVFNTCIRNDNFERKTYLTRARNTGNEHRNKIFSSVVGRSYTLTTDYLKDWEMKMFAEHIASSPECYLHIISEDIVLPVNITTGSMRHNTFRANNRQYFTASINVEVSRDYFIK